MTDLLEHAQTIIAALLAVSVGMAGWIWHKINQILSDHEARLHALDNHQALCREELLRDFVQKSEMSNLTNKIDEMLRILANLPHIYRTKEEARTDWQRLEGRLSEIKSELGERINSLGKITESNYNNIWDKINRLVDFMHQERARLEQMIKQ